jgi:hypothetical protein
MLGTLDAAVHRDLRPCERFAGTGGRRPVVHPSVRRRMAAAIAAAQMRAQTSDRPTPPRSEPLPSARAMASCISGVRVTWDGRGVHGNAALGTARQVKEPAR